jgi:DIS3-like exonuclease 1
VASPSDWCIKEEERRVRRDLTDCMVCSIDPPSCTDVDDALHVKRLSNGQVEVGVHIADVSYFVREGGLLDAEAMDRCTSVYLVDRRIDMLPSLLSEHLCSLRAGVERFSVSVIWILDEKDMRVSNVWMGRSLIRSRYQLTYQEAQDIFEGRPPPYMPPSDASSLTDSISFLFSLTRMLRGKRKEAGALLDLAGGELKFGLDPNTGRPIEVIKKEKLEAMDMIAEMMILANREVAEQIVRDNPGSALLRNHPPPTKSFEGVAPFLSDGASIDPSSNKTVSQALDQSIQKMRAQDNKAAESLVCSLVTQCMNEAQYLSSGSISAGSQRHYGLALEYYTHFTSPIRRYADIIVHRQMLKTCTTRHQELSLMAQKMNERHRQAKEASKVCNELFLLDLFVLKPHVVEALVVKILADRSLLEVFIPSYSIKGVVKLLDASGTVIPPLGHDRNKSLSIRTSSRSTEDIPQSIEIVANESAVIWSAEEWQTVLVELSAQSHRAHGPRLQIRVSLLDPQHQGFLLRHQTSPFTPPPPLKSEIINEPVVEDDVRYHSEGEEGWKVACVPMPLISGSGEDATDLNEARELRQVRARVEAKIDRTALGSKRRSELIAIKAKLDHLLLTLHMPLK